MLEPTDASRARQRRSVTRRGDIRGGTSIRDDGGSVTCDVVRNNKLPVECTVAPSQDERYIGPGLQTTGICTTPPETN